MNTFRLLSLVLCLFLTAATGWAVELASIDRSISREPDYQTAAPRYCLLVFGDDANRQVWLVVDGDRLYIDRNANGDLTEDGELVTMMTGSSFSVDTIAEPRSARIHQRFKLQLYDQDRFRLSINLASGCRQTVGYGSSSYVKPRLGQRPEEAPIIHLNGPMTFARYGPISFLPRHAFDQSYRQTWLRVFIGSPGLGEGTFAGYNCKAVRCGSGYRSVTADVEFANQAAGAPPVTRRNYLTVRG